MALSKINKKIFYTIMAITLCIIIYYVLTDIISNVVAHIMFFSNNNLENININGNDYKVLSSLTDKEFAAKILSDVDANIKKLIVYINDKYSEDKIINTKNYKLYKQIRERLNKTYSSNSLIENYPLKKKVEVSYNYDKGKVIALCLRDYETKYFHDFNDIMFVALHELSHSINYSFDHNESFWGIFKLILLASSEIHIFKDVKYSENNVNYCSMNITYNPIYDKSLSSYN